MNYRITGLDAAPFVHLYGLTDAELQQLGVLRVVADVTDGRACDALIRRVFEDPDVAYVHVHNAKRGCYSGRIDRV